MTKDRRLGRGLAALLGSHQEDSFAPSPNETVAAVSRNFEASSLSHAGEDIQRLSVHEIDDNPFQPRRDFDEAEIASLAESLKEHDMLQPILVRRVSGRFQLISGERRLRAAISAGWTTVPVRIRDADDRLVAELAIVENLQRKDLNPIEKALSFKRYLDQHQCTQEDLAGRLKIDRSTIANLMRLLELPEDIVTAVRTGRVSAGHARALLPLGSESEQIELCQRVEADGLSVRAVESIVQERINDGEPGNGQVAGKVGRGKQKRGSGQLSSLEQEIRLAVGMKVDLVATPKGKGKLTVHFRNHDEFDRLRSLLCDTNDTREDRRVG